MSRKRRDNPKAWSKRRKRKKGSRPKRVDPRSLHSPRNLDSFRNELDQISVLITEEQLGIQSSDSGPLPTTHLVERLPEPCVLQEFLSLDLAQNCRQQVVLLTRQTEPDKNLKHSRDAIQSNALRLPTEIFK